MVDFPQRSEVWVVNLDPTVGSEIKKTRPCVIVSPDQTNKLLKTVIVAPLTTTIKNYPTRVNIIFADKKGSVVLDQIRTVDKKRLLKKIGIVSPEEIESIIESIAEVLVRMFTI